MTKSRRSGKKKLKSFVDDDGTTYLPPDPNHPGSRWTPMTRTFDIPSANPDGDLQVALKHLLVEADVFVEAGRFKDYREKQRVRALEGVKAKREDNRVAQALLTRVLTMRAEHPRWETRKVAAHILEAAGKVPRVTERARRHPEHQAAIEALHQRIYRLLKQKS